MSCVAIDFETLKFNLYEVLGIDSNASEIKIKKAFRNLILNFHPDKNNSTEEEIYYHIITANQVLINTENRKKYDEFLNKLQDNHDDLKSKFNTINNNNIKLTEPENKSQAEKQFNNKFSELEQKHLSYFNTSDKTLDAYSKIVKEREKTINIPKEDIKTTEDFNVKFESRILTGDYFKDQIISVAEKTELSTINVNDNYTSLDIAFNNLYIEGGGINTSKFSSLDSAFKIQPISTKEFKEVNIKNAIDAYKNETHNLSSINYSKEKFDSWQ
jgi:curved DNA-binding protein CbpA